MLLLLFHFWHNYFQNAQNDNLINDNLFIHKNDLALININTLSLRLTSIIWNYLFKKLIGFCIYQLQIVLFPSQTLVFTSSDFKAFWYSLQDES